MTISDVAKIAGVDPSTVSRVLNSPSPNHQYAPATVRKIRVAADRLGYRPSRTAQALRTGKTFNLGLLVADIGNPFWGELAARIERLARAENYRLLVCNTDESPTHQADLLADLSQHGVDGLIVAPCGAEGLHELVATPTPVVTIDREVTGLRLPHIGLDDLAAGRLLGAHLRARGYGHVGIILPSAEHDPSLRTRAVGLAEAVAVMWESAPEPTELRDRLRCSPQPDTLVGLNNTATLAALEAITELALPVPGAIGLTGIDDFVAARFSRPAITVVAQPLAEIAGEALRILLDQIADPEKKPPLRRLVPPALLERDSLRPATT